jgi:diacylglycerol kinase (ATP)
MWWIGWGMVMPDMAEQTPLDCDRNKTAGTPPWEHVPRALGYSLEGLSATFRHELAFRIELFTLLVSLPFLIWLPVTLTMKALVLGSMLLVLMVELLNSAMEWVVDLVTLERHPYAKRAKDMGSAAVFVALLNSGLFWGLALADWRGLL